MLITPNLPEPDLDNLEILLVDQKSVCKRHGYVTVVLNGLTGELRHMAEGKEKESLESFSPFSPIRRSCFKIKKAHTLNMRLGF